MPKTQLKHQKASETHERIKAIKTLFVPLAQAKQGIISSYRLTYSTSH